MLKFIARNFKFSCSIIEKERFSSHMRSEINNVGTACEFHTTLKNLATICLLLLIFRCFFLLLFFSFTSSIKDRELVVKSSVKWVQNKCWKSRGRGAVIQKSVNSCLFLVTVLTKTLETKFYQVGSNSKQSVNSLCCLSLS